MWCQNPESISPETEIAFYSTLCINCGDCERYCPEKAVQMDYPGRIMRERCVSCGRCVRQCQSTALKIVGKYYSVAELIEELEKDRVFYETSHGGVTFSGGEPTLHMDYLSDVMVQLKKNSIHVAIQTSGMFDITEFREKLFPHIDLIFYDIKLFNTHTHREFTGMGNQTILDNFTSLAEEKKSDIIPRTPLIPRLTATEENLRQIAAFVKNTGCRKYELLPYNPGGITKMKLFGKTASPVLPSSMMSSDEEKIWKSFIEEIFNK
jgi:pyruvate formate lyase activating enzyme